MQDSAKVFVLAVCPFTRALAALSMQKHDNKTYDEIDVLCDGCSRFGGLWVNAPWYRPALAKSHRHKRFRPNQAEHKSG